MLFKQVQLGRADLKAGPADGLAEGEFIVYPSTFTRVPDAYGDVVLKGAFADGIRERQDKGIPLPGLFGHRMDDPEFWVASATEESEDDHGWRVRGIFDLDTEKSMKVYKLVKGGRLRELSFSYNTLEEGKVKLDDGQYANELRKLETFEFSFVPIGANRDTSVVAVKSAAEALLTNLTVNVGFDGGKAGRVLSAKNEAELRAARDAIDAVLSSLESDEPKASTQASPEAAEPITPLPKAAPEVSASTRMLIDLGMAEVDSLL